MIIPTITGIRPDLKRSSRIVRRCVYIITDIIIDIPAFISIRSGCIEPLICIVIIVFTLMTAAVSVLTFIPVHISTQNGIFAMTSGWVPDKHLETAQDFIAASNSAAILYMVTGTAMDMAAPARADLESNSPLRN